MMKRPDKDQFSLCTNLTDFMNFNATGQLVDFWSISDDVLGCILKNCPTEEDLDLYSVPHIGGEILAYAKVSES